MAMRPNVKFPTNSNPGQTPPFAGQTAQGRPVTSGQGGQVGVTGRGGNFQPLGAAAQRGMGGGSTPSQPSQPSSTGPAGGGGGAQSSQPSSFGQPGQPQAQPAGSGLSQPGHPSPGMDSTQPGPAQIGSMASQIHQMMPMPLGGPGPGIGATPFGGAGGGGNDNAGGGGSPGGPGAAGNIDNAISSLRSQLGQAGSGGSGAGAPIGAQPQPSPLGGPPSGPMGSLPGPSGKFSPPSGWGLNVGQPGTPGGLNEQPGMSNVGGVMMRPGLPGGMPPGGGGTGPYLNLLKQRLQGAGGGGPAGLSGLAQAQGRDLSGGGQRMQY